MKKRGELTWENVIIVLWLLLFLTLFMIFVYGPEGFTTKMVNGVKYVISFLPGQKELPKKVMQEGMVDTKVMVPYQSLLDAIGKAKDSKKERCLQSFKQFPDLEDGSEYFISFRGGGGGMTTTIVPQATGQSLLVKTFPDLVPCLVGGKDGDLIPAHNFYLTTFGITSFSIEEEIVFTGDRKPYIEHLGMFINDDNRLSTDLNNFDDNGFKLDVGPGGSFKNSKQEPILFLYKADKNHICLIASPLGDDVDEDGIGITHMKQIIQMALVNTYLDNNQPIQFCNEKVDEINRCTIHGSSNCQIFPSCYWQRQPAGRSDIYTCQSCDPYTPSCINYGDQEACEEDRCGRNIECEWISYLNYGLGACIDQQ